MGVPVAVICKGRAGKGNLLPCCVQCEDLERVVAQTQAVWATASFGHCFGHAWEGACDDRVREIGFADCEGLEMETHSL